MIAATNTATVQVDAHSVVGHQHGVNQDYVFSSVDPVPYVILGDGCSSSPYTDIGVRLLVLGARQALLNHLAAQLIPSIDSLAQEAVLHAHATLRLSGLPPATLDATLIVAFVHQGYAHVYLYGDGAVIQVNHTGQHTLTAIEYSHNAPYYPSYRVDKIRDREYRAKSIAHSKSIIVNGNISCKNVLAPSYFHIALTNLAALVIASDGLDSVIDTRRPKTLTREEVVEHFLEFRNANGAFVQRRLRRTLKQWAKQGIVNSDDLSVGALVFHSPGGE